MKHRTEIHDEPLRTLSTLIRHNILLIPQLELWIEGSELWILLMDLSRFRSISLIWNSSSRVVSTPFRIVLIDCNPQERFCYYQDTKNDQTTIPDRNLTFATDKSRPKLTKSSVASISGICLVMVRD